jgi:hypothetical protein
VGEVASAVAAAFAFVATRTVTANLQLLEMCPKNNDPLTISQQFRTIKIALRTVSPSNASVLLTGSVGIRFMSQIAVLNASATQNTDNLCAEAFKTMQQVRSVSCRKSNVNGMTGEAEYIVAFTEWSHSGSENNVFTHDGNPPISAFQCDLMNARVETDVTTATAAATPTCEITDIQRTNLIGKLARKQQANRQKALGS